MVRRVAVGGEGKRNVMMRCPRTSVANSRRKRNARIRAVFGREVTRHAKEGGTEYDNLYILKLKNAGQFIITRYNYGIIYNCYKSRC